MTIQTKKKPVVLPKSRPATVRKGVKRQSAPVCATGEQCFWSSDGHVLSSLGDLKQALSHMSADVYAHHVTSERNDFADWVEFVLHEKICANGLRKAKNQKTALMCIHKALANYA